ncbi:hypothetical protein [Variovorax sp. YR216]|uniref:hypothetical protein n=1 Tax=Variovorax sp. YR216 TaxID=1882828 RepID=UPI000896CC47|nr:hypothetical protein [Variovorax sp. YR216]SEA34066.1 hypothetical protein SAMN05444680_10237 [Variovorax sp. YR216]
MQGPSISLIPPGSGGVKDYAVVVGGPLRAPPMELSPTTDSSSWSGDLLLLHFSGYGFQKRGVPLWLVKRISSLRQQFRSFGVVFHELFAFGPPWGSAFWLNGLQKQIAREVLSLSDFWLTNRDESARWLLDQHHDTPHRVLPVFSNVGEPDSIETERLPRMVVFGSSGVRANVYQWADGEIFRRARTAGLEIHDIGPPQQDPALLQRFEQEGVVAHGKLSAAQVSIELSAAACGALAYPTDYVSKSGVFAAYCAHGICPVLLAKEYGSYDGLSPHVHYVPGFDTLDGSISNAKVIGREAREWYEPHRIDAHVAALQAMAAEVQK